MRDIDWQFICSEGIKEVDTSVFPQQLLIDYVRVYKKM